MQHFVRDMLPLFALLLAGNKKDDTQILSVCDGFAEKCKAISYAVLIGEHACERDLFDSIQLFDCGCMRQQSIDRAVEYSVIDKFMN